MKKLFLSLFMVLISFGLCFAGGRISVTQGVRYSDSRWDDPIDTPTFSLSYASETYNGKIQFQHIYTVEEATEWNTVRVCVVVPSKIGLEALSLNNGTVTDEDSSDLLPRVHWWDETKQYKCISFYMRDKKKNTATLTFSLDISESRPNETVPLYVYFYPMQHDLSAVDWTKMILKGATFVPFAIGAINGKYKKDAYEDSNRKFSLWITK